MANVDTWLVANKDMPHRSPGPYMFRREITTGTALAENDVVRLCQIPRYVVIKNASLKPSGTLGASATAQLRRTTTALTAATTAAAATAVVQNTVDQPNVTDGTDYLNILIAGAAAGTSAVLSVEASFDFVRPELEV
jgi:hypothetical protein